MDGIVLNWDGEEEAREAPLGIQLEEVKFEKLITHAEVRI